MLGYFMTETDVVQNYPTNFEAWIEEFNDWQTRIGFDPSWLGDYRFDIKFDWDTAGGEIEFGDFEGMPKWERSCLLYTSPSPRDRTRSRMPSSA